MGTERYFIGRNILPKAQEECAIGIPHPHLGEAVRVFVIFREDEADTAEDTDAHSKKDWQHTDCQRKSGSGMDSLQNQYGKNPEEESSGGSEKRENKSASEKHRQPSGKLPGCFASGTYRHCSNRLVLLCGKSVMGICQI